MIVRVPTAGIVSVPVEVEDLSDGPGDFTSNALSLVRVNSDETALEFSHVSQNGKYRQFTFIVTSGDFSFIKDINGRPVMALIPLE